MQWICFIEIQGLYAEAARAAGLVPPDQAIVVLRQGLVYDGCRQAFTAGLVPGVPARQALRDAPCAVHIDFDQIEATARATLLWQECLAQTPYIEPGMEPHTLHRLFLALPAPGERLSAQVKTEATRLVARATELGAIAFGGLAGSKLVARAAALTCKQEWLLRRPGQPGRPGRPEVFTAVPPGGEARFLAPLPVIYLPAPAVALRRLARLGMNTIGEVARIPESEWLRQLGPLGRQIALWSQGMDPTPVLPSYPPRAMSHRVSFSPETCECDALNAIITRGTAALARRLTASGEGCQRVELTLEQPDGSSLQASRTLARLQQGAYSIQQAAQGLLAQLTAGTVGLAITALRLDLSILGPMPWHQLDLWEDQARRERAERMERALSLLHERFPQRMIGLGPAQQSSWVEQMRLFSDPHRFTLQPH